jgi:hypothetical protein
VLACGHENLLEVPEEQGGGGEDLLGLGADHQALYLKRRRETGGVDAMPIPGRPRVKEVALEGWLPGHLRENPDLTLEEHLEAFERGEVDRPAELFETYVTSASSRRRSLRVRWSC